MDSMSAVNRVLHQADSLDVLQRFPPCQLVLLSHTILPWLWGKNGNGQGTPRNRVFHNYRLMQTILQERKVDYREAHMSRPRRVSRVSAVCSTERLAVSL
jgi:hypothetical protein